MKKNLFFKLGLFCATLVLVATCFITNAWAKYTKTVTATDTARVAKFVVDFKDSEDQSITTANIDIFGTTLKNIKKGADGKNIVEGSKLIAPGSHGSFQVKITNDSEVSIDCLLKLEITNEKNIPLVFCIKEGTDAPLDSEYAAYTAAITKEDKMYVNDSDATDATVTTSKTYTIWWQWKYYVDGTTDGNDTTLGTEGTATVTATLTLTATQIVPAA